MKSPLFTYPIIIKEAHLDTFGHMNNAVYLSLLEEARWELLTQNGFGLDRIKMTGIGPTILAISIRFLKEIRLRDNIVIETQVVSYERKIALIEHRMLRGTELCCTCEVTIALFDLAQRKIINPTPEWLLGLGIS